MMIARSIGKACGYASSKNALCSCPFLFNQDVDGDRCHQYDDDFDLDGDKDKVIELQ